MGYRTRFERHERLLGRVTAVASIVLLLVASGSAWASTTGAGERTGLRAAGTAAPSVAEAPGAAAVEQPTPAPSPAVTEPPTPRTAPPAPTTTAAPPPPAPTTVAPAPPPTDRLRAAFERSVPASWRAAIPVELVASGGSTSWAYPSGRILVSAYHRNAGEAMLENVLTHEFGHLIAFRYGSQAYAGAGPAGWPAPGYRPEEVWSKCVAKVFTGDDDHSFGMAPCGGEQLSWASAWLSAGPPAVRTG